jgi:DNA-binding transcriptional LysR family regulator
MDLAGLRTLLVVAQEGSFSRAAVRLHRTQPAVSLAVRRLEARVGATLINREAKRPELTEAGRVLADYAQRMWTVQDEARAALATLRGLRRAEVRVAVEKAYARALLPLIRTYRDSHAHVLVEVLPSSATEIAARLARGDVELGVLDQRPTGPDFESVPLGTEALVVVTAPDHRLAIRRRVVLADVARETVIVLAGSAQAADGGRAACGVQPPSGSVGLVLPSMDALQRALEQGLGVAILPVCAVAAEIAAGRLTAVPLADPEASRRVWLVRAARPASVAAAALFELAVAQSEAGPAAEPSAAGRPPRTWPRARRRGRVPSAAARQRRHVPLTSS